MIIKLKVEGLENDEPECSRNFFNKNFNHIMRSKTIDITKGLCMFLIVIGHCLAPDSYVRWIFSSFHVPMFFLLSGLLFNEKKWSNFLFFLKARFKSIMIPCISFTIITSLISSLLLSNFSIFSLGNALPGALWFLPILFITELIYHPICLVKEKYRPSLLFLIAIIGLYSLPREGKFSIYSIPLSITYYGLGHYLRICGFIMWLENNNKILLLVLPILIFTPLLYLKQTCDYVSFSENIMSYSSFVISFVGIFALFGVALFIKGFKVDLEKIMLWVGKNTIIIMGIHMLLIGLSSEYIAGLFESKIVYKIIEQFILWTILYVLVLVINKKIPWIIGK